jgi:peroxiredoxin family protein
MSASPLFLVLCSAEHEKIQMAAMLASVAAVSERPVQVFVSMNAVFSFRKDIPAEERYRGGEFSRLLLDSKAPDPMTLFEQGKMLGDMSMYVCSMAKDVTKLSMEDFVEGLFDGELGLTKFLSDAEDGELVFL